MKPLQFYFDYVSPYSYFAWKNLEPLCQKYKLQPIYKPVPLGVLLNHFGQLGPAEIPAKRKHTFKECYRFARLRKIPFCLPKTHPFRSLNALRLSLPQVAGDQQKQVIDTLWKAIWGQGIDGGSDAEISQALSQAKLPAEELMDRINLPQVKEQLIAYSQEAIGSEVFGVPTFRIENENFWGVDQIPYLELFLQGQDPLRGIDVAKELSRPIGIERKR